MKPFDTVWIDIIFIKCIIWVEVWTSWVRLDVGFGFKFLVPFGNDPFPAQDVECDERSRLPWTDFKGNFRNGRHSISDNHLFSTHAFH